MDNRKPASKFKVPRVIATTEIEANGCSYLHARNPNMPSQAAARDLNNGVSKRYWKVLYTKRTTFGKAKKRSNKSWADGLLIVNESEVSAISGSRYATHSNTAMRKKSYKAELLNEDSKVLISKSGMTFSFVDKEVQDSDNMTFEMGVYEVELDGEIDGKAYQSGSFFLGINNSTVSGSCTTISAFPLKCCLPPTRKQVITEPSHVATACTKKQKTNVIDLTTGQVNIDNCVLRHLRAHQIDGKLCSKIKWAVVQLSN